MALRTLVIKLTDDQKKQFQDAFGEAVSEITITESRTLHLDFKAEGDSIVDLGQISGGGPVHRVSNREK